MIYVSLCMFGLTYYCRVFLILNRSRSDSSLQTLHTRHAYKCICVFCRLFRFSAKTGRQILSGTCTVLVTCVLSVIVWNRRFQATNSGFGCTDTSSSLLLFHTKLHASIYDSTSKWVGYILTSVTM